jgi:Glycosyltransferase family 87
MEKKSFTLNNLLKNSFLLRIWIPPMVVASSVWLGYEFWRLVWDSRVTGALDLIQRYEDIFFWFREFQVYGVIGTASYPPASYVLLWPLLGWLSLPMARLLWAVLSIAALVWLCSIFRRESKAVTRVELAFITLIPLSMYASGAATGNGQLIVLMLPVLLTALLLLHPKQYSWKTELTACFLFLLALVKPTTAAPFFWIVLFIPGRLRAAFLVVTGYVGLTLFAGSFQNQSLFSLITGWLDTGREIFANDATYFSQSNIHSWLVSINLEEWITPLSLLILALLGIWIKLNKTADPWLIISVTAIIARLWTYHAWYDDLLIAPSIIALFRLAKTSNFKGYGKEILRVSPFITVLFMIAPGGLYLFPSPWKELYTAGQTVIWISILTFLTWFIHREKPNRISPRH